jgi:hypothetical protein
VLLYNKKVLYGVVTKYIYMVYAHMYIWCINSLYGIKKEEKITLSFQRVRWSASEQEEEVGKKSPPLLLLSI